MLKNFLALFNKELYNEFMRTRVRDADKWGIDLRGRKMWYKPWLLDENGHYRQPTENEKTEIYGISGEAVKESLEYFEECGGDSNKLVALLNDHAVDDCFKINRDELLDASRWYNNEYYFYFQMFCKKVIGRYSWHFGEGGDEQLSVYHKIWERGLVQKEPFGEEKSITNNIPVHFLTMMKERELDCENYLNWIDGIAVSATGLSYKRDIFNVKNFWLTSEFICYIYEFVCIIFNVATLMNLTLEGATNFNPMVLAFLPKRFSIKVFELVINRITNVYNLSAKFISKNTLYCKIKRKDNYDSKSLGKYLKSAMFVTNTLLIGGFRSIIKRNLNLADYPDYILISPITKLNFDVTFTLKRKNREFLFQLITGLTVVQLSLYYLIDYFLSPHSFLVLILLLIAVDIIFFLFHKLRFVKKEQINTDLKTENTILLLEENYKDLERVSQNLILEKISLEQTVEKRTAELSEANENLKVLNEAKSNFFATVSHELRTPLTLIKSPMDAIVREQYGKEIPVSHEVLGIIQRNTNRLSILINDLLNFSRIETHHTKLENRVLNICSLMRLIYSEFESAVSHLDLQLDFRDKIQHNLFIMADQLYLERAVFNLLTNAIKFTPDGGQISIELDREDNHCLICIRDTGIGIKKEMLDRIFEKFRQGEEGSKRKYEGLGIGLALVNEIIHLHGGRIEVESKVGKGSCFTLLLPLLEDQKEAEEVHLKSINAEIVESFTSSLGKDDQSISRQTDKSGRRRILVADDNADMRRYIAGLLQADYDLVLKPNGKEAWFYLQENPPVDIIISDVMMPEMNGNEFLQEITKDENLKKIPFIFLTARADEEEKIQSIKTGSLDYIVKPFEPEELTIKIKRWLAYRDNLLNGAEESLVQEKENRIKKLLDNCNLSKREKEVFVLLRQGLSHAEIGYALGTKPKTVSNQVNRIFYKLDVHSFPEMLQKIKEL